MGNNKWIWWSLGAILATAVLTVVLVGALTGQWPWNRGEVDYNGRPEKPTESVTSTETTVPEDTTAPKETQNSAGASKPTNQPTEPTTPNAGSGTGNENQNGGGNGGGNGTGTGNQPTKPTKPTEPEETEPEQPKPTEPEETEPEQTKPATKPTEPEDEEDEGGGEKPQPGDIDVPIGPRP